MPGVKPLSPRERRFFIYFFAGFFVFLLFPGAFYFYPPKGVDGSRMMAIYLAIKNNLQFGKDLVHTSGPLAVLRLRYPFVVSKYVYLLGDIYFVYVLFTGFRLLLRKHFYPGAILFLFCCILIDQRADMEKWYLILILLFLFSFLEEPGRLVYLIHAGLLTVICFYINGISGLIDAILVLGVLGYALVTKKMRLTACLFFLFGFFAALFLGARLLHTDFPAYLAGSIRVMKDYEGAMYLPLSGRSGEAAPWCAGVIFLVLLIAYIFALVKWIVNRPFLSHRDTVVAYGLVAFWLVVWYKNSFVRGDDHLFRFFEMVCPLVLFLYLYTPRKTGGKVIGVLCWLVLGIDTLCLYILPGHPFPAKLEQVVRFRLIPDKIAEVTNYFNGLAGYDRAMAGTDSLLALPNSYKSAVGDHAVDIIPSDVATIYSSGLRYSPRPSIQSYAAYNSWLDGMNYDKYLSAGAPDYLFFTLDGMEERFQWVDEGRVKLALLARYQVKGMVGNQLLLQKNELPREMIKVKEDTITVRMGEEIPVRRGPGFQFSRFFIREDLSGKLRSLFYQPPPLVMVYTLDDGEIIPFHALAPVLSDGFILNKFVNSTQEFRLFLLSDGRLTADVRSMRIQPLTPGGYQPEIKMVTTWYRFADRTPQRFSADSLALLRLTAGNATRQPLAQPPADSAGGSIRYGIASFRVHGGMIRISGWAVNTTRDNSGQSVKVLARSGNRVYDLPTESLSGAKFPDDPGRRKDLDSLGFSSVVSRWQLPTGNYQVGLAIYDDRTGKGDVRYIDRYFDNEGEYRVQKTARIIHPSGSGDIKYNIDRLDDRGNEVQINGWAILTTAPARTVTNLILQNDTAAFRVNTGLTRREDIMGVFKAPGYEYSGFSVTFPKSALPSGSFLIGIEKVAPDGRTVSEVLTDRRLKTDTIRLFTPVRTDSLPPAGEFMGNIDGMETTTEMVRVGGWALWDTIGTQKVVVGIVLQGANATYICGTESGDRPDIAGRYKNKELLNCGFSAQLSAEVLPKGKYRLGICLRPTGSTGREGVVRFFDQVLEIK